MASVRYVFKTVLRVGLVNVPVRACTAAQSSSSGGDIGLNQLHKECNSRIQYKKTCPIHGELSSGDILSGYEFSKEQYVVIDPGEVDKLRPQSEKAINIEPFIALDSIDPMYLSGSNYYLTPDDRPAAKPVRAAAAGDEGNEPRRLRDHGVARRDHVALLRFAATTFRKPTMRGSSSSSSGDSGARAKRRTSDGVGCPGGKARARGSRSSP